MPVLHRACPLAIIINVNDPGGPGDLPFSCRSTLTNVNLHSISDFFQFHSELVEGIYLFKLLQEFVMTYLTRQ